jgi:hypothetical protein
VDDDRPRPWYRHGWVWLLIAIPGSSVVVGVVMIVLAASSPNDLVRDDYYKAGLAINQDLDAERRAEALGVEVVLEARGPETILVRVDLGPGRVPDDPGAAVRLELQHPTLADRDVAVRLEPVASGRWAGIVERFDGTRHLRVEHVGDGWRVQRDVRAPRPPGGAS